MLVDPAGNGKGVLVLSDALNPNPDPSPNPDAYPNPDPNPNHHPNSDPSAALNPDPDPNPNPHPNPYQVLSDALNHSSIVEGVRGSGCKVQPLATTT